MQAITINANGWSDAGHAVNHLYDILFMMNRDDIPVGVGGEGGISLNGLIMPEVGGYLPIIDQVSIYIKLISVLSFYFLLINQSILSQGMSTEGGCRYRQAIPLGLRGRLDINTNYGLRKGFLPKVAKVNEVNHIAHPHVLSLMQIVCVYYDLMLDVCLLQLHFFQLDCAG